MAISKAVELAGAGQYPSNRLNQRERKVVEVAESYSPSDSSAWSTPPSTQDSALDLLAASGAGAQYGMVAASVLYDFSVNGGAIGNINLSLSLPDNAVIVEVTRDVLVAPDSADDLGTIRLNVPTDGNMEAAITADGAGASLVTLNTTPQKLTAARTVRVTIATTALTVGKIRWFIRYMKSE